MDIVQKDLMAPLPGQRTLHLKAWQTVFYDQDLIHRGVYDHTKRRATLHFCIGKALGGHMRAWNVCRTGIEWMKDQRFIDALPENMRPCYHNLWTNKDKADAELEGGTSFEGKGVQN